jgi:GNAT superfamily N-acetyltransferase
MAATDPNWRRAGIGRRLYEQVFEDLRGRRVSRVQAITWPGNRISVAFHKALGFRIDDGPGTQRLYGTPAYPDYDGYGEERVVFTRQI